MPYNRRLKAARVLRDMTQRDLAEKLGIQEIEISRFETGRKQPDARMKQRIAEILDMKTFEIFAA